MKISLTLLSFILFGQIFAQHNTFSASIFDGETGEVLIGANVFVPVIQSGTATNNFGFFSLSFEPYDSVIAVVSFIGYESQEIILFADDAVQNHIFLYPQKFELDEFTVNARILNSENEIGVINLPVKTIDRFPSLGGESDIMKVIQLMSGIQSGAEGSSGLYVRGGSPDQNLMIIDDIPMYYINHLGGFVSIFNTDILNRVKLYKAGFPARFGGRLSSVVDIHLKEGNKKKLKGKLNVGMITSGFLLEGPVKKDTSSFIISARRFMYDLITRPASQISNNPFPNYSFYDVNAKFNHTCSQKDKLFFSLYLGNDKIFIKHKDIEEPKNRESYKSTTQWGNFMGTIRWNHLYNLKLFSIISLSSSRYRYNSRSLHTSFNDGIEEDISNHYYSGILDYIIKSDFEYSFRNRINLKFGHNLTIHQFSPGMYSLKQTGTNNPPYIDFNKEKTGTIENSVYFENNFQITKDISANAGLRYVTFFMKNKTFTSVEPRIMFAFHTSQKYSFKVSFSKMQQFVHLLTYSGLGTPTDLWVPSTNSILPENAGQFSFEFNKALTNKIDLNIGAYYKKMDNLISLKEGILLFSNTSNWENKIETGGKGSSKGLELMLKKSGNLSGWATYTLSKTDRQFKQINNGEKYPFKYDRRHDLSIVAMYTINDDIDISGSWVYGSGYAITLPLESFKTINTVFDGVEYSREIKVYDKKNNYRMRDFHKLDLGINFHKQKKKGTRTWRISIYNVYNRKNPYYYFVRKETVDGNSVNKLYQQSLFPFIPSIGYSFSW